jgi:hypothetical protein
MLCDQCQRHDANYHLTTIAEDGQPQSRHLCRDCFTAEQLAAEVPAKPEPGKRCSYCGASPCAGGTDVFAHVTCEQKKKYLCLACATEYGRYVQEQLRSALLVENEQDEFAFLLAVHDQTEQHMRAWVTARASK